MGTLTDGFILLLPIFALPALVVSRPGLVPFLAHLFHRGTL
jgi:hypothetical protein